MRGKTIIARKLRNNLTEAEKKLWYYLRKNNLGVKLIIEVDGGQHNNSVSDSIRDDFLKEKGFKVLRFWNNEVLENIEGVLLKIKDHL